MNEANLPTWVQWLNVVTHEAHTDGNGAICTHVQTYTHQNKHHCGSPGKKPTAIPLRTLSASLSLMCSSVKGGAHTSYNRSEESTCSSLSGSSVVRHCFKIHNGITLNFI